MLPAHQWSKAIGPGIDGGPENFELRPGAAVGSCERGQTTGRRRRGRFVCRVRCARRPLAREEFRQFPRDKLIRLLGCAGDHSALVRQASLLLGGDFAVAGAVVQDSFAAQREAWSRLGDLSKARLYLCQAVVSRSRSGRGHPADGGGGRHDRRGARPGDRPGGGGPEELTSQFRVSHRWHVSARIPLPPYH